MALQGDLKDFELPEIFQLITSQQKTGILRIEAPENSYAVHFSRGFIQIVEKNPEESGRDFIQFLVKCGVLKKKLAQEIVNVSRKTAQSPYELLIKEDVNPEEIKKAVWLYILENMLEIITKKRGNFQFLPRKSLLDPGLFEPLGADHVLMETYRIADELKKETGGKIPWDDVYELKMERRDAFEEAKRMGLKGDELKLVLLIDGRRTLEGLALRSGLGRLEALRTIRKLEKAGIAGKIEEEKEAKLKKKAPESLLAAREEKGFPFYVLALLVLLIFGFTLTAKIITRTTSAITVSKPADVTLSRERLESALELYQQTYGHLPEDLSELFKRGIISKSELTFDVGRIYYKIKRADEEDRSGYILLIPVHNGRH